MVTDLRSLVRQGKKKKGKLPEEVQVSEAELIAAPEPEEEEVLSEAEKEKQALDSLLNMRDGDMLSWNLEHECFRYQLILHKQRGNEYYAKLVDSSTNKAVPISGTAEEVIARLKQTPKCLDVLIFDPRIISASGLKLRDRLQRLARKRPEFRKVIQQILEQG